jgi:cytochrome c5
MSQHDPSEHSSFIKTPQQLIVVIVLAFVVPIGLISLIASLAFRSMDPHEVAASDEAVAKRLKPVGEVVIAEGKVPPEAIASAAPAASAAQAVPTAAATPAEGGAAAAPVAGGAAKGKAVYDSACTVCHTAGVAGAPKLGDKAAWGPRMKDGVPHLYDMALKGKGAMPPRGGNPALSEADIKAAVDFIVSQAK